MLARYRALAAAFASLCLSALVLVGCYQSHTGSAASCGGDVCSEFEQCCATCERGPRCQSLDLPCPDVSGCDGCNDASDCGAGEVCIFAPGTCAPLGTCLPREEGCPRDCPGVCGCDGEEYCNACEARGLGVSVAMPGPCDGELCAGDVFCGVGERCCEGCFGEGFCVGADEPCPDIFCPGCFSNADCAPFEWCLPEEGLCGAEGVCIPRPDGCDADCPGVCGCDGLSYCNECEAASNGVAVRSETECEAEPCGRGGEVCDEGFFCEAFMGCGAGDAFACSPVPDVCPDIEAPVCGCDGVTYGNDCLARANRASIATGGPCETRRSCRAIQRDDPSAPTGVYRIEPEPGRAFDVLCDMETDGGGWTMVASTRRVPPDDARGGYHPGLTSTRPDAVVETIWDGMRAVVGPESDVRFTCGELARRDELVDLSFYRVGWYLEWTTGTDADSCFSEGNGRGYERPAPARRDNLTGRTVRRGTDWAAGFLEGEDSCDSPDDFTVDLIDRGMDSNQMDGTDWGRDDNQAKCGRGALRDGAWHVWVREI